MEVELSRAVEFENLIHELLVALGYNVGTNFSSGSPTDGMLPDLVVTNANDCRILIESKFYRTTQPTLEMLTVSARNLVRLGKSLESENLVLIVAIPIAQALREEIENLFKIVIIDGFDLERELVAFPPLLSIYQALVSDVYRLEVPFEQARQNIFSSTFGKSNFDQKSYDELSNNQREYFEQRFLSVKPGKDDFSSYEEVCGELLKYLFKENLSGWEKQPISDDGLNRFDLVCRVNRGNQFWDLIIDEFHSRYVVFEFKNYSSSIQPTQIYTTEKYLFQKALRNVAFVLSRSGLSTNSTKATKGILRETGKLILGLTDADLLKMVSIKETGGISADYLFELLDTFLIKLEK